MGSRKLLAFFFSLIFIFSCHANEKIFISNCVLTENSLIIEISLEGVIIYDITDVRIDYKNISRSILFETEEITYDKTDSEITINLALTNKILYTNEEAEMRIKISGGFIMGDVFIGNPISKIDSFYVFPSKAYEKVRIILLSQHYIYRM
jgi:predicted RNA-binding protein